MTQRTIKEMDARIERAYTYICDHPGRTLHWQLDLELSSLLHVSVTKAREYVRKLEASGRITVSHWNGPVRPVTQEESA